MSLEKIDEMIAKLKLTGGAYSKDGYIWSNQYIEKHHKALQEIKPIMEQLEADKRDLKADTNKIMEVLEEAKETLEYVKRYVDNRGLSAEDDVNETLGKIKQLIDEWKGGNNE